MALVVVKAAWLRVDSAPMLFLGDSESYLTTALDGWIPPDRSFLYGMLLRVVAVWPHSLAPLLLLQAACSVLAALLLAAILRMTFHLSNTLAFGVAFAWAAMEPLALLYERYLMTEAVTLPLFAAFTAAGLRYVSTMDLRWLALAHTLGLGVLMLRYPFVPVAWLAAFVLPLIALGGRTARSPFGTSPRWRPLTWHLLVSLLLVGTMHHLYKMGHGKLANQPPAYQFADGLFLASAWAPLLHPEDFGDPAIGRAILDDLPCALGDRHAREAQRWSPGCLISRIEVRSGSALDANTLAKSAALSALRRDPAGVASLALRSWGDWFEQDILVQALHYDRGEVAFTERTLAILSERFGVDGGSWPRLSTPTNQWFFASAPWLMFLAASPLFVWIVVVAAPRRTRRHAAWIMLLSLCLVGISMAAATKVVPRYMHVVAWLATVGLGVVAFRALREGIRAAAARSQRNRNSRDTV